MRGAAKHATIAVATAVSCAVLFTIPMVLRYKVYEEWTFSMTSGDHIPLTQRVSSVWCSSQTVRAQQNHSFLATFLPQEPEVIPDTEATEVYQNYSSLRVSGLEYWAFYLPTGSQVNLSTCARLPGATVTVVRGQENLAECFRVFRGGQDADGSEESEESEGDDSQKPSSSISSSEGVFTQEATEEGAFHCPHLSLLQKNLASDFSCSQDLLESGRTLSYLDSTGFQSPDTDYYYVIFSTGAILDLIKNEIHWKLQLDRTTFDLGSSYGNCSSDLETDHQCHMPLSFASSQTCLVKLSAPANSSIPLTEIVISTCEPRKGLYFVFFLLIFLAIGFCAFQ